MTDSPEPIQAALAELPPSPPVRRRRRWWVSLLLSLAIFVGGLITGAGVTMLAVRNEMLRYLHHPEQAVPRIAAQFRRDLKLNDTQTRQVETILMERQAALQSIRHDVQPRLAKELKLLREQVSDVLDEDQRQKWQAKCNRFRDTWFPPMPKDEKIPREEKGF